ncbi:Uncharacterised protein [Mycobacteroides abscessus subsp. massiliense]|nr:Uncharacterised protein [Mycobacteroides abscessus subsp. massiliense]
MKCPYADSAGPIAGPATVITATTGIRTTIVSRAARDMSPTTAEVSSAAALRLSRGMIAVRMVTPTTP